MSDKNICLRCGRGMFFRGYHGKCADERIAELESEVSALKEELSLHRDCQCDEPQKSHDALLCMYCRKPLPPVEQE